MNQFRMLTLSTVLVVTSVFVQAEETKPKAPTAAATVAASSAATAATTAAAAAPATSVPATAVVAPTTAVSAPAQDLKSAIGKWKSIDDETGKPKSIIEISETGDAKLSGKIVQLFREPSEDQNPKCDKCNGDKKDQPILNMQIMQGFIKKSEGKWADGEILDPKNGKVYSCKLTLTDGGKKLEVRGFIGFSLLGRTQVWERM